MARRARVQTRRTNGQLAAGNVRDFGIYDTRTGRNVDNRGDTFLRVTRADQATADRFLRNAANARNAEVANQRNKTRNSKGQFLNKADKQRNARSARAKQSYDIKRALGVSVG